MHISSYCTIVDVIKHQELKIKHLFFFLLFLEIHCGFWIINSVNRICFQTSGAAVRDGPRWRQTELQAAALPLPGALDRVGDMSGQHLPRRRCSSLPVRGVTKNLVSSRAWWIFFFFTRFSRCVNQLVAINNHHLAPSSRNAWGPLKSSCLPLLLLACTFTFTFTWYILFFFFNLDYITNCSTVVSDRNNVYQEVEYDQEW